MTSTTAPAANTTGCLTCFGSGTDPDFGDACANCEGTGRKATAGLGNTRPRYTPGGITEPQVKFLTSLADDLRGLGATVEADEIAKRIGACDLTSGRNGTASQLITRSLDLVKTIRQAQRATERTTTQATLVANEVTDGFYVIGEGADAVIVKVQMARGSGNLYGKQLVMAEADGEKGRFEYAPGIMGRVARQGRKLTLEEAKHLGHLYGICCCCGATLTDEGSIAAGIGPVCAKRL